MLQTFFNADYELLYEQLGTKGAVNAYTNDVLTTLNELHLEFDQVQAIAANLKGSFTENLYENIDNIISNIINEISLLDNDFQLVLDTANEMYEELNEFKTQDQIYTLAKSNYDYAVELQSQNDKYETDKNGEEKISWFWQQCEDDKNEALAEYTAAKKIIDDLIEKIDSGKKVIEDFNDRLSNQRIKTTAIFYSTNGIDLDEIANMTLEEKEDFIQQLIDNMSDLYYQYVDNYKSIIEKYMEDNDLFLVHMTMFEQMTGVSSDVETLIGENRLGAIGFHFVDFLSLVNDTKDSKGRNAYECLQAYLNGESFKDSGLQELYLKGGGAGYLTEYTDEQVESWWLREMEELRDLYGNDGETLTDFLNRQEVEFHNFENDINSFVDNYYKAVEQGSIVRMCKELKIKTKYDHYKEIIDSTGYEITTSAADIIERFNNIGYYDEANTINYLNEDEIRTLCYLYEQNGVNGAREFINDINSTLSKRKGYINAYNTYEDLMNGNVAIDSVKSFFIGVGDGLRDFGDGLVDLVSPNSEISADEYAQLYLIDLLVNDENFRSKYMKLLYDGGNTGSQFAVSSILNYALPGLGSITKAASTIGSNRERTQQYNESDEVVYSGDVDSQRTYSPTGTAITGAAFASLIAYLKSQNMSTMDLFGKILEIAKSMY